MHASIQLFGASKETRDFFAVSGDDDIVQIINFNLPFVFGALSNSSPEVLKGKRTEGQSI